MDCISLWTVTLYTWNSGDWMQERLQHQRTWDPPLLYSSDTSVSLDSGFIRCSASLLTVVSTSAAQMLYLVMRFLIRSQACCKQRRHLGMKCWVYFIDICLCPRCSLANLWCICSVQKHLFSRSEEFAWDPCLFVLHHETSLLWYVAQGCHEKVNLLIDLSWMKVDISSSV
jgi:hypothetical protein